MTNKTPAFLVLLLSSLFLIVACDRSSETEEPEVTDEFVEDDGLDQLTSKQRAAYDLAMTKLAPALGDDADRGQLLFIQSREWPDSSLGCAEPGVEYLQVVTPGYSLRIAGKGKTYVVNTGGDQAVVCNQPGAGLVHRPRKDIHATQISNVRQRAIDDLAARLDVDPSLIQASQLIPATWTSAALGCPEPGVEYEKEEVSGFQMYLGYQDRAFTYNTDGEKVIPCPPISAD